LNFSDTLVEAAKSGLDRILTAVDNIKTTMEQLEGDSLLPSDEENKKALDALVQKYEDAMEDDLNTADAVSAIFEIVKLANTTVKDGSKAYAKELLQNIQTLCDVLGILTEKEEEILDSDIEALIEERQAARKEKNFQRADEIRDQLLAMGIVLKDTREGVKWSRA
jgi:cysteinyl-tRNA synthetase